MLSFFGVSIFLYFTKYLVVPVIIRDDNLILRQIFLLIEQSMPVLKSVICYSEPSKQQFGFFFLSSSCCLSSCLCALVLFSCFNNVFFTSLPEIWDKVAAEFAIFKMASHFC